MSINPAFATPLWELLRAVPKDERLTIDNGYVTHCIPVGKHCHDAADLLQKYEAAKTEQPNFLKDWDKGGHTKAHLHTEQPVQLSQLKDDIRYLLGELSDAMDEEDYETDVLPPRLETMAMEYTGKELRKMRSISPIHNKGRALAIPKRESGRDNLYDIVGDCLTGHKMLYHLVDDGTTETVDLLDIVTPHPDTSTQRGHEELEHLRDEIVNALSRIEGQKP